MLLPVYWSMQLAGQKRVRFDWILLVILVGALAVRLSYLWYYSTLPEWDQLTVDNYYHHHWAQRIAAGDPLGDTTYFRAPFYVWCLGFLYAVIGDSLWVGRMFGAAVGVATVWLTFLIARRVFDRTTAVLAAAILATYPVAVYFDGELLLDSLFTLLLLIALYRFFVWYDCRTGWNMFLVGLSLGIAAITRPTALIYGPVLVLAILAMRLLAEQRLRHIALFAGGAAICVLPIFARNLIVANDPVLIASQGGVNLYIGNNAAADGVSATLPEPLGANWRIKDITYAAEKEENKPLTSGQVSDYWNGRALNWITENPGKALGLYLRKLVFSIANREISNNRDLQSFFARVPFLKYRVLTFAVIFAFGLGAIILAWRNPKVKAVALTIAALLVANSLYFVNSRFRLPVVPLLIVLAAFAALEIVRRARRSKVAIAAIVCILVAAMFSFFPPVSFPSGTNVQGLVSQALYYYSQGDYRRSIEVSRRAELFDPTYPEVHLNIGAAYFRLGNTDSAQANFMREIALHPLRSKAYSNLASLFLLNYGAAEARTMIQNALARQPYDLLANLVYLRIVAADSTASDDIVSDVAAAVARTDSNMQVIQEGAGMLTSRRAFADAESLLVRSTRLSPPPIETDDAAFDRSFPNSPDGWRHQQAKSHYLLGYLYGMTGRYDQSVAQSSLAIAADSSLVEAYVNLVSGYLSLRDQAAARQALQVAVVRFPTDERVRQLVRVLGSPPK